MDKAKKKQEFDIEIKNNITESKIMAESNMTNENDHQLKSFIGSKNSNKLKSNSISFIGLDKYSEHNLTEQSEILEFEEMTSSKKIKLGKETTKNS